MTEGPASITEAFPPDDAVACFVVTMAWVRTDVRYAIEQVGRANCAGALEFAFWIRFANGFVYEAIHALKAWRQHSPPVATFLRDLPSEAQEHLRQVAGVEQRIGNNALEHLRNRVFHYPHPDPGRMNASVEELPQSARFETAVAAFRTSVNCSIRRGSPSGWFFPPTLHR
jgi:hypothetical protein